ncbi:GIY-YIG nuclease family protein [Streptomyces olivaceus]|uniref:GIY-YIG nuclease family protein n=1 Tax=Streptomyces olivaceus TaxID=47716 RepID=UPI001CCA9393|nr:GIY-YIG nuclease family protein [Streptomyces olivaceus]MBZ6290342.1 GIY-YIG nuclease family protein [Streptomyces olivaceus]MBZ6324294.1 GIY-YIG nuclease family protein [Streptomyces olivaceus]
MYLDDHRTALYRFFDTDGALLYVGITYDIEQRFASHSNSSPWWKDIASERIEWHETRSLALAAESAAIKAERPRYNINGSPWAPGPRELNPEERTVGELRSNVTELCAQVRYLNTAFVVVDRTKARRPIAALVSMDFYERALAALDERAVPAASDD